MHVCGITREHVLSCRVTSHRPEGGARQLLVITRARARLGRPAHSQPPPVTCTHDTYTSVHACHSP